MKFYYKVTDEFIQNELLKGNEVTKNQVLDIDFSELTTSERETILMHSVLFSEKNCLTAGCFKCKNIPTRKNTSSIFYHDRDAVELNGTSIKEIVASFRGFEAKRKELIVQEKEEVENEITSFLNAGEKDNKRIFGNGIYSDYSGSFDFEVLEKSYNELVQFYGELNVSFNEIESMARNYIEVQAKVEEERQLEVKRREKERLNRLSKIENNKQTLKEWATKNGSELLKYRIKHEQNWQNMAEIEWAIANSVGFELFNYEGECEEWEVKNASLKQLKELEKAQNENPNHEISIIRCKWSEFEETIHRTFLQCAVKTPTSLDLLVKEIDDISDEE